MKRETLDRLRDSSGRLWALVFCKPLQEPIARLNLRDQGLDVLWIYYSSIARHARAEKAVLRGLYPPYLFAAVDDPAQARAIDGTRGVNSVVRVAEEIMWLRPKGLAELRAQCLNDDGLCEAPPEEVSRQRYQIGQEVLVTAGPFAGFIAMVAGDDGKSVAVLHELFGRTHKQYYDPLQVELPPKPRKAM